MPSTPPAPPHPWTRLHPAGVPADLTPSSPTLLHAWRRTVAARRDRPAVLSFDRTLTFGTIDAQSDALAVAFQRSGVLPGDRIAVHLQNDPQWLVTLLAAWKCGATAACINPMLRREELRHHLADAQPTVLVSLDSLYADVVAPLRAELGVRTVITTAPWDLFGDAAPPTVFAETWGPRRIFADTVDWLQLQADHAGAVPDPVDVDPADVALLTYTSGTTGRAKGAMNTHGGMAHNVQVYASWHSIDPDDADQPDVVLGVAPLFHITGTVAGLGLTILTGAPIVLLHRFDAAATLEAIERHRVTFTVAASTAYNALASHPDVLTRDLTSLRKAVSGGAPLGPALVARVAERAGWRLLAVYGLTETTSPATMVPPGVDPPIDPASGALSVGVPVPGADVRIADIETGEVLGAGAVGEICVAGPMVVPGYWNAPEETAHAVRDGWLFSGDVGVLHEDGWLFVVDRKKDLINAGGYKIWPREVEDVLLQHPAVREAAVVGVPDEYRGETVHAYVSLRDGTTAEPAEIIAFCREHLAAYKYPRLVSVVGDLPKNASGKILRRELRTTELPRGGTA
ncbi:AMP-binding protein [Nakamurella leprariae]|uniref:AMP-binding protein n=1 Tax=Nakamurella leprariae TaxID=2803911 RepID=A0A938YDQ4_9ACTN|nr:AMP-binding protein [Nakamurella leprariae]MBM9467929.1 AMP-binding protein [Nakamurella leprariae]